MNDFAASLEAKSDQINASDLTGGSQTIKITRINVNMRDDQPVSISYEGSDKVYRPCKGMRRVIAQVWGADPAVYPGRSLTVYRDPDVRFGKDILGGTRISHMSHIEGDKKSTVPVSRGKVKTYTIKPLQVDHAPQHSAIVEGAMAMAQDAAAGGTSAFTAWWNSEVGKMCRDTVKPNMDELKATASAADVAKADADAGGDDEDGPPM